MKFYPKWKYRGAEGKIVEDAREEYALGPEWGDTPGFERKAIPDPVLVPTPAKEVDPKPHVVKRHKK